MNSVWIKASLVFIAYYWSARFGLSLGAVGGFASFVWPPTGIAMASILVFGAGVWPGIFLAAFLVNFGHGASSLSSLGIGLGNTLEPLFGAWLLQASGFRRTLERLSDVLKLIVFGALFSSVISATIGTLSLRYGHLETNSWWTFWVTWWLGDALSCVIIIPFLLVWYENPTLTLKATNKRLFESGFFVALMGVSFYAIFLRSHIQYQDSLKYMVFPLTIWAALRFGLRTAVTISFVVAVLTVVSTLMQLGPFVRGSLILDMAYINIFVGTVALTGLIMATAVIDRGQYEQLDKETRKLAGVEARIRTILHTSYDAFVGMDLNGLITEWNQGAERTFGWQANEVMGQPLNSVIIPESLRKQHNNALAQFRLHGKSNVFNQRLELPALHRSGAKIPVEVTISPIKTGYTVSFGAFLRDISEQKKAQKLRQVQLDLTRVLAESNNIARTSQRFLETLASGLDWEYAGFWVLDSKRENLILSEVWHRANLPIKDFIDASRLTKFQAGRGMPGRVWAQADSVWIFDVTKDENFPRAPYAEISQLHGAAAFPVWAGEEFIGVVEVLSYQKRYQDQLMLDIMSDLGSRFGMYIHRRRIEESLRGSQNALKRSEESFRFLVEGVKDYAIFMLDQNGYVTTWNPGVLRINGYTAEEIIGKHFSCFYTKEAVLNGHPDKELQIASSKGRYEEEGIRVRKDGSLFWASVVVTALHDTQNRVVGFSKVTRDITDRKRAEERLKKMNEELEGRVEDRTHEVQMRESQLRLITDAMPIMVIEADRNLIVRFANNAIEQWYGTSAVNIVGKSMQDLLGVEHFNAVEAHFTQVLQGKNQTFEREIQQFGRRAIFANTLVPEYDVHGEVTGFIGVASDVTTLKEAKDAAEAASTAKSAFLANMSHEIRTPLGVVLGFCELLAMPDQTNEERANAVDAIKRNGKLLSNIINDILDLSKVEAGKLDIEKADVSLAELVTDINSLLYLEASEKGLSLNLAMEGKIPEFIFTDALRLRQILINIIGNAIKFTESGFVNITVKSENDDQGNNKLVFLVEDSGRGISQEQSRKLFEPFTQADSSTVRKFGGTGLGLALSRKLAIALGGYVTLAKSSEGSGSLFKITIDPGRPMQPSQVEVAPAGYLSSTTFVSPGALTGLNILLVEDSLDNQILVSRMLMLTGAKVEIATNGRESVEKALHGDYDLVLMDLRMPEMDGYQAVSELRAKGFTRPVIALTANAMKEDRIRCLASGFNDHLGKPIDRDALISLVARFAQSQKNVTT